MHRRILKEQNAYLNEDVIFLGTGTSLLEFDLSMLSKNLFTFGFNHFIPFYKEYWPDLKLDFYCCHDSSVLQNSFYRQQSSRDKSEIDYGLDLNSSIMQKYMDIAPSNFIIDNKLYKDTKIIISSNIIYPHASRFGFKQNSEWIDDNKDLIEHPNFLPYKSEPGRSYGQTAFYINENEEELTVGTWAKNSFLNTGLLMLYFLGFKNIFLAGVDFSDEGNFFCVADPNIQKYVPREFNEFDVLMEDALHLSHLPNIFTVKSDKSKIVAKDGWIGFEKLITR